MIHHLHTGWHQSFNLSCLCCIHWWMWAYYFPLSIKQQILHNYWSIEKAIWFGSVRPRAKRLCISETFKLLLLQFQSWHKKWARKPSNSPSQNDRLFDSLFNIYQGLWILCTIQLTLLTWACLTFSNVATKVKGLSSQFWGTYSNTDLSVTVQCRKHKLRTDSNSSFR